MKYAASYASTMIVMGDIVAYNVAHILDYIVIMRAATNTPSGDYDTYMEHGVPNNNHNYTAINIECRVFNH